MIKAYLDESGTHEGAQVLCVACYQGSVRQWKSFLNDWRSVLRDAKIPFFHARDPKCESLKPLLVQTINKHGLTGVAYSVNPPTFKEYSTDHFRLALGNAYASCAFLCVEEVCYQAKQHKRGGVVFLIEDGQPNDVFVRKSIEGLMKDDKLTINKVELVKKKNCIPLQAADFLSHLISDSKIFYNKIGVLEIQTPEPWLYELGYSNNIRHAHMTPEALSETSAMVSRLIKQNQASRRKLKKQTNRKAYKSTPSSDVSE